MQLTQPYDRTIQTSIRPAPADNRTGQQRLFREQHRVVWDLLRPTVGTERRGGSVSAFRSVATFRRCREDARRAAAHRRAFRLQRSAVDRKQRTSPRKSLLQTGRRQPSPSQTSPHRLRLVRMATDQLSSLRGASEVAVPRGMKKRGVAATSKGRPRPRSMRNENDSKRSTLGIDSPQSVPSGGPGWDVGLSQPVPCKR